MTYARTSEPDVLSCSAERQLWVMWYGGQLAVGRGDAMGRRVLLAYEEPLPALTRSIAVSTPGGNGTWRFSLGPPRDAAGRPANGGGARGRGTGAEHGGGARGWSTGAGHGDGGGARGRGTGAGHGDDSPSGRARRNSEYRCGFRFFFNFFSFTVLKTYNN